MSSSEYNKTTILLNGRNWQAWRFQTQIVLRSKKLLEIVLGREVRPKEEGKIQESWDDREIKAQEVIVTRVEETVMRYLISCTSSADMWKKLMTIYEPSSKVGVHLLQQKFFNLTFEEPMAVFMANMEDCMTQLQAAGEKVSEKMAITKILMSLPEKYKHFISAWESMPEEKQSLQELTGRLLVEEERSGSIPSSSASTAPQDSALVVGTRHPIKCFDGGKVGHKISECMFLW